ncbi:phosphoribosylformylglycinamidine cyclo-ligase [Candidatus Daviesbacteria bacterium]|nr:phosphoribosylformylglycinamidine cyclo-ligase [Candidatus Daviesbacteria bacterium]MBI4035360.1 phosphoribosylformylglycinamidine cyclo-ligase [Candidatus Daviesbacteria bacterium]
MKRSKHSYSSSGVDYHKVDPLKKLAQGLAKSTFSNSNIKVVEKSIGETAFVWEEEDCYRAFVIEGLGTKNLIADEMRKVTGKTYYDNLAQDTVAMIVNDLIVVGAKPQIINAYFAAGSSDWFADEQRAKDLTEGWAKACKLSGAVWGGGESPSLSGTLNPNTGELAGAAIGIIIPKERLTLGDKITSGDTILLIESSGLHSNGISLVRKIVKELEEGVATKLPNGNYFGEEVLIPTHIYAKVVDELFEGNIDIHYMVNITGHGWRKIMRASKSFSYIINQLPTIPSVFTSIQQKGNLLDKDMYETFNMGAGFAVIINPSDVEKAVAIIKNNGFKAWDAGIVEEGPKEVVIQSKNIIFEGKTLDLR